jgi:hypothetical protein
MKMLQLMRVFVGALTWTAQGVPTIKLQLFALPFNAAKVTALALLFLATAAIPAHADAARPSFLRSVETRSNNLNPFIRWTSMLVRAAEEAARLESAECRFAGTAACSYQEWLRFLDTLRGLSKWEQLVAVNGYINARAYVPDEKNWGVPDHWATPGEFLSPGRVTARTSPLPNSSRSSTWAGPMTSFALPRSRISSLAPATPFLWSTSPAPHGFSTINSRT